MYSFVCVSTSLDPTSKPHPHISLSPYVILQTQCCLSSPLSLTHTHLSPHTHKHTPVPSHTHTTACPLTHTHAAVPFHTVLLVLPLSLLCTHLSPLTCTQLFPHTQLFTLSHCCLSSLTQLFPLTHSCLSSITHTCLSSITHTHRFLSSGFHFTHMHALAAGCLGRAKDFTRTLVSPGRGGCSPWPPLNRSCSPFPQSVCCRFAPWELCQFQIYLYVCRRVWNDLGI